MKNRDFIDSYIYKYTYINLGTLDDLHKKNLLNLRLKRLKKTLHNL